MSGSRFIEWNKKDDTVEREAQIMLQLVDILFQDNLITPEEKFRLRQFIRRGGSV